jgi:aminoglycoside phosphotransferase family enzyme/predicted kinase
VPSCKLHDVTIAQSTVDLVPIARAQWDLADGLHRRGAMGSMNHESLLAAGRSTSARTTIAEVMTKPVQRAGDLANDLLRPEAYPAPGPLHVELLETHISWVFLTEGEVFKIKKPVTLPFLDFSTLDARRRACEAELLLDTRLAASTYLGLVPVRRDAQGRHHFGPQGEVVDWAVHMMRLPDEVRADRRLEAGTLSAAHVDEAATMLADFHARAGDGAASGWGTVQAITRNVRENFAEADASAEGLLTAEEAREVERCQLDFLRDRARTFERRIADGRIRDGHGDLRLEHLYFGDEGGLTILDCIEFSDRFRYADVCADVAFLSMDLAAHGHVELAERFLARYARAADDYDLYTVVDFYEAYRAHVRAKVSLISAARSGASGTVRDRALADARRHFALALSAGRRSLLEPVVAAVGGVIASGKSTVADALGDRLSAPVIDADRTRKHLVGMAATTHDTSAAFEGPYTQGVTDRVYAELMLRATAVLESGRPVVLDGSFRSEEMRRAARDLATAHGVPFLMIECRARPEVCRERLVRRERESSVSDGRLAIFDAFAARMEPVTELDPAERLIIDTERPLEATLAVLDTHLLTWPPGLTQ